MADTTTHNNNNNIRRTEREREIVVMIVVTGRQCAPANGCRPVVTHGPTSAALFRFHSSRVGKKKKSTRVKYTINRRSAVKSSVKPPISRCSDKVLEFGPERNPRIWSRHGQVRDFRNRSFPGYGRESRHAFRLVAPNFFLSCGT